jgi:hypothetical protein
MYAKLRVFLYDATIVIQFLTRVLTVVMLLLLLTVVAQFKACMTPQQLPPGVGVPQSQPFIPKGQSF